MQGSSLWGTGERDCWARIWGGFRIIFYVSWSVLKNHWCSESSSIFSFPFWVLCWASVPCLSTFQQVLGSQLLFLAQVQGQAGVGKSLWLSARTISQQTSPWPITRGSWFTGQLCLSLQHQRCVGTHTNEERAYDALCHQPRVTQRGGGYCGFTKGRSSKSLPLKTPSFVTD